MSTKLRVVIKKRGMKPMYGPRAVNYLIKVVKSRVLSMAWPVDWDRMKRREQYSFLAQFLPNDTSLLLIREGRRTRRNRSLYVQMLKKDAHMRAPMPNIFDQLGPLFEEEPE